MIRRAFIVAGLLLLSLPALAQSVFAPNGVAIRGYDPVAYFTESRPVQGNAQFTHSWNGATWRFASAANRDAFAADPQRYAPQYGGFCAFAMAQGPGERVEVDPTAWRIVDGRLYLNYSASVNRQWVGNMRRYIDTANGNWSRLNR